MTSAFNKLAEQLLNVLVRQHNWELVALQEENRQLLARLSEVLPDEQLKEFLSQKQRRDSLFSDTSSLGSNTVAVNEPSKSASEFRASPMPVLTVTAPAHTGAQKQATGSDDGVARFGTPMPSPTVTVTAIQKMQADSQDSDDGLSDFASRIGTPMPCPIQVQTVRIASPAPCIQVSSAEGSSASNGQDSGMRMATPMPFVQVLQAEGSSASSGQDCGIRIATPMPFVQLLPAEGSSASSGQDCGLRIATPMPCIQVSPSDGSSVINGQDCGMRLATPMPCIQVLPAEGSCANNGQDCGMRIATPMPCIQVLPADGSSASSGQDCGMRMATPMPCIQVLPAEGSAASNGQDCGMRMATPMPCIQVLPAEGSSASGGQDCGMRIATPMPCIQVLPVEGSSVSSGQDCGMRITTPMPCIQVSPAEGSAVSNGQDCCKRMGTTMPVPAIQVVPVQGNSPNGNQDIGMRWATPLPPGTPVPSIFLPGTPVPGTPIVGTPRPSLPCITVNNTEPSDNKDTGNGDSGNRIGTPMPPAPFMSVVSCPLGISTPLPGICVVGADGTNVEPVAVSAQDLRISTPMPGKPGKEMPAKNEDTNAAGLPDDEAFRIASPLPLFSMPADGESAVAFLEGSHRRVSKDSVETITLGRREFSMDSAGSLASSAMSYVSKSTIPVPKTAADLYGGGPKRNQSPGIFSPPPAPGNTSPQSRPVTGPGAIGTSYFIAVTPTTAPAMKNETVQVQSHRDPKRDESEEQSTSEARDSPQESVPQREGSMTSRGSTDFGAMESISIKSMDLVPDARRLSATPKAEESLASNGVKKVSISIVPPSGGTGDDLKAQKLIANEAPASNPVRFSQQAIEEGAVREDRDEAPVRVSQAQENDGKARVRRISVAAAAASGWFDDQAVADSLDPQSNDGGAAFTVHPFWAFNSENALVSRKTFVELINGGRQMPSSTTQYFQELQRATECALEENELQRWCQRRVPLHPDGVCRVIWEMFCLVLISYDFIMLPLHFFEEAAFRTGFFYVCSWVGRLSWTLDLVMSFLTGHYHHGVVEMRTAQVAKLYVKSWFVFDVALVVISWATIEKDGEEKAEGTSTSAVRTLRLVRFLRLLRLFKVEMMLRDILERFNSNYLILCNTLVKCIVGLAVINHIIACIWYHVGASGSDGWVQTYNLDGRSFSYQYFTSVHWSLAQFTGSVDINPVILEERCMAVIVLLLAIIVFSSFISTLSNTMLELQSLQSEKYAQQRVLRKFLHNNLISPSLSLRVKKYLRGVNVQETMDDQAHKALETLPRELQKDLLYEIRSPLLYGHMFLSDLSASFPRLVRQICHEAINEHAFLRTDFIFTCGDACNRIYFVQQGEVNYIVKRAAMGLNDNIPSSRAVAKSFLSVDSAFMQPRDSVNQGGRMLTKPAEDNPILTRGMWLSEAAMWTHWEHCGDLLAVQPTNMLTMDNGRFAEKVSQYSNAYTATKRYALCFVDLMNSGVNCTDLMEFEMPDSVRGSMRQSMADHIGEPADDSREAGKFGIFLQTVSHGVTSRVSILSSTRASLLEKGVRFSQLGGKREVSRLSAMHSVFARPSKVNEEEAQVPRGSFLSSISARKSDRKP